MIGNPGLEIIKYKLRIQEGSVLQKGKIVKFFEHKKIVSGICLEVKGSCIHVLREDGREIKLSINRVIHASSDCVNLRESRKKLLKEMEKRTEHQKDLMKHVSAGELREVAEDSGQLLDLGILARTVFGESSSSDHEAAVLCALMKDRIHFKFQGSRFLRNTPEQVEKLKTKTEKELKRQQEIEEGSSWLRSVITGKEVPCKNRDKFIELLKGFVIFGKEAPNYRETGEILKKVGISEPGKCFDILVELDIWDEDENLLLQRHQVSHTWSGRAIEQVEGLLKAADNQSREDLTSLKAFSVDDPFTRDIDDAISLDSHGDCLQLGVHITDAASFIASGTPLDKEAAWRGASLYLPEAKIPMIPQALSENILSLGEGKKRPAISFLVKLSPDGEILDFRGVMSVVMVTRKLSYDEVDADIEKGSRFLQLYNLACRLRERRDASGATRVLIPELHVRVDKNKKVFLKIRDKESPSQVLVSECMIVANYCASLLFKEKKYPALYRKQAEPAKRIEPGSTSSLFQLLSHRRNFSRVEVDVKPGLHSTLGLQSYTSVTSPLRKYLDLVTQRQLVGLLRGDAPFYAANELKDIAALVQSVLTKAAVVEHERKFYWVLKVLKDRAGEELKALVLDVRSGGYNIILTDYLLDVHLKVPEGVFISPGDTVSVIIKSVDPFAGTLRVKLKG